MKWPSCKESQACVACPQRMYIVVSIVSLCNPIYTYIYTVEGEAGSMPWEPHAQVTAALRREARSMGISLNSRSKKFRVACGELVKEFAFGPNHAPVRAASEALESAKAAARELEACRGETLCWKRPECVAYLERHGLPCPKRAALAERQELCAGHKWMQQACGAPAAQPGQADEHGKAPSAPSTDKPTKKKGQDAATAASEGQGPSTSKPAKQKTPTKAAGEGDSAPKSASKGSKLDEVAGKDASGPREKRQKVEDVTKQVFRQNSAQVVVAEAAALEEIPENCRFIIPRIALVKLREAVDLHGDLGSSTVGLACASRITRGKHHKRWIFRSLFVGDPASDQNYREQELWAAANTTDKVLARQGMCHLYFVSQISSALQIKPPGVF